MKMNKKTSIRLTDIIDKQLADLQSLYQVNRSQAIYRAIAYLHTIEFNKNHATMEGGDYNPRKES